MTPEKFSLQAEQFRLRRRLMRWRILALAAVAVVVTFFAADQFYTDGPYIARVEVNDIIVQDRARSSLLRDLAHDPLVEAVILELNSPGGTTYGGEQLFKDLQVIQNEKPVVTVMGTLATSAAYMAAMGTDYIVAGETTLTGSVGVIMQTAEITGLLEKIGIEPTVIKSGDQKAVPNPFEPLTEAGRDQTLDTITETFDWFIGLVQDNRNLSADVVAAISDGRVVTGRYAVTHGLIDAIGAEPEARTWLNQEHDISLALETYSVWPFPEQPTLMDTLLQDVLGKSQLTEALMLDGLVALWHPVTY